MHLLFTSKLQHVMSHYTSNKGSVINKQTSLINNPQLFNMQRSRKIATSFQLLTNALHDQHQTLRFLLKQNNNGDASRK